MKKKKVKKIMWKMYQGLRVKLDLSHDSIRKTVCDALNGIDDRVKNETKALASRDHVRMLEGKTEEAIMDLQMRSTAANEKISELRGLIAEIRHLNTKKPIRKKIK